MDTRTRKEVKIMPMIMAKIARPLPGTERLLQSIMAIIPSINAIGAGNTITAKRPAYPAAIAQPDVDNGISHVTAPDGFSAWGK
jgi:hypothetical protein